jgi:hypothetical protein
MFYSQFISSLEDKSFENVRSKLNEKFGINVYLNVNQGLYILLYPETVKTIDNFDNEEDKYFIQNARGLIVEYTEHRPVCMANPVQIEITSVEQLEELKSKIIIDSPTYKFYNLIEGTYIRMYYHEKWRFATTRMIDSSNPKSKYNSHKTFKQLFLDIVGDTIDFTKFNKEYTYQFVLQHPENRITRRQTDKKVFLYEIVNNITGCRSIDEKENILKQFEQFNRIEEIEKEIQEQIFEVLKSECLDTNRKLDFKEVGNGYMIGRYDKTDLQPMYYRIESNEYKRMKELMYNTPDINLRFIRLLRAEEGSQLEEYQTIFVDDQPGIQLIINKFEYISKELYRLYGLRFKRPIGTMPRNRLSIQDGFIDKIHYPILMGIHEIYKTEIRARPDKKTVQLDDIIKYLRISCDEKLFTNCVNLYNPSQSFKVGEQQ